MLTQRELELECYGFGKGRASTRIAQMEAQGAADQNPYASAVYNKYLGVVSNELSQVHGDARSDGLAHLVIRQALVSLLAKKQPSRREFVEQLGTDIYHEILLETFDTLDPDLFHELSRGRGRNLFGPMKYRLQVFMEEAGLHGLQLDLWDLERVQIAGLQALQALMVCDVVSKVNDDTLGLSEEAHSLIDDITAKTIERAAYYLPCVEQPMPWTSYASGGWHTAEMRRLMPYVIKGKGEYHKALQAADLSQELACINSLQRTAWRVNARMLDALDQIAGKISIDEIVAVPDADAPRWLKEEHRKTKNRYKQVRTVANKFLAYPAIYFVYFCDFRGRKYAMGSGINPQGSDLQKCLLEFAKGMPLKDQQAVDWFMITGSNRYGFDKCSLADRVQWCHDNHNEIIACAEDPLTGLFWKGASKPLQFLAWCFEYAAFIEQGPAFVSRVSADMDGTCNGLQHFSAMLRDEIGAAATNLVPADLPSDIYAIVARKTQERLQDAERDPDGLVEKWLQHGINRSITKRSTMTLPYGSTRFSSAGFVRDDYLLKGKAPEFDSSEHNKAAQLLSTFIWPAIGETVVKAREGMDWLQTAAKQAIKQGAPALSWTTPTGFPVHQVYNVMEIKKVRTKLAGAAQIRVYLPGDVADPKKHAAGAAPNFVHSMDASHLTATVNACAAVGIKDFAMIHDSYAVHCCHATTLARVLREEFVKMYTGHDVLAEFAASTGVDLPRPEPGSLDLGQVMEAEFFFS
ncbi:32L [Xanthomonas phage Xp10]|uniref:DNA-directed RNA polymerase n=1 Tax=Xanthomonas phage Xp10 TaxID=2907956 RepID=Q7Y5I5_9CAUD|nr:N4-like RNA polymerase [Xanthomonas phage Xp10]AAP58699.1 32L [Xanthomonas phage Xp10]